MSSLHKLVTFGVALLLPLVVSAESLVPEPPEPAKKYNEKTLCVEPVDEMRRNHMNYILHQRDATMREGVRTTQHSLKECIDCHNAPDPKDGKVANIESKNHFCSTCHTYAAVNIDCFDCHADKPANTQYRHSLSNQKMPQHQFGANQELNANTLNTLAAKEERQQ